MTPDEKTKPKNPKPAQPRQGLKLPEHLFGGRMRTSTMALIIAFIGMWFLYETYQPVAVPEQVPATEVVPPGFIPDPSYTWVPRTAVRRGPTTVPVAPTPTQTTSSTPAATTDTSTTSAAPSESSPSPTTSAAPATASPTSASASSSASSAASATSSPESSTNPPATVPNSAPTSTSPALPPLMHPTALPRTSASPTP